MRPGVVCVKLHPVPGALAEVYLQSVVIGVPFGDQLSNATCCIWVHLEEVDRIACACDTNTRIIRARGKCRASDHVAEPLRRSRQRIGKRSRLPGPQVVNEPAVLKAIAQAAGARKGCIHNWQRNGPCDTAMGAVSETRAAIQRKICLCVLKFSQKSIFENIYFIGIDVDPLTQASITDIADFESLA